MLELLRAWLNGKRDYKEGVALYKKLGDSQALYALFVKAKTAYTQQRLVTELTKICDALKSRKPERISATTTVVTAVLAPINQTLYDACIAAAHKAYKEMMNARAVLFASANMDGFEDPNRPDLVQQRSKSAVDVVLQYQEVSKLYEKAAFVQVNNRLPATEVALAVETEYDALPDHLVKPTLDNLRKSYNKMRKREQTPERIVMLQKHEGNIDKLKARWLLLKQV